MFSLAKLRLDDLCTKLKITKDVSVLMSACLRHAIESQHAKLLAGRHVDQLIMACMHAVWIVGGSKGAAGATQELSFSKIIRQYRTQPQADPKVCYEIPLGGAGVVGGGGGGGAAAAAGTGAPTPPATGDIIAFYNGIFVPVLEPFIRSLCSDPAAAGGLDLRARGSGAAALPLPDLKSKRMHSPRRVGRNSSLTVSPISATRRAASQSPQGSLAAKQNISYAFHHSPSKNLDVINNRLKGQADHRSPGKKSARAVGEEGDDDDDGEDNGGSNRRILKKPRVLVDSKFLDGIASPPEASAMQGSPLKRAYTAPQRTSGSSGSLAVGGRSAPAVVSEIPIRSELGVAPLAASPEKQARASVPNAN